MSAELEPQTIEVTDILLQDYPSATLEVTRVVFTQSAKALRSHFVDGTGNELPTWEKVLTCTTLRLQADEFACLFLIEAASVVLDRAFFEYLCRRSRYEVIASVLICAWLGRREQLGNEELPDTGPLMATIHGILAGRSVLSKERTRLDDLQFLFRAEKHLIGIDSSVRLLFGYELLLAGETLSPVTWARWLVTQFGPLCSVLPEEILAEEFARLSKFSGVTVDGGGSIFVADVPSGIDCQLSRLAELMTNKQMSIFVGAGVSKATPSVAPTWFAFRNACFGALMQRVGDESLLKNDLIERLTRTIFDSSMKPELVMQLIFDVVGERLLKTLSVLAQGTYNANHDMLAAAAKSGYLHDIVTTNFDLYIEQACAGRRVALKPAVVDEDYVSTGVDARPNGDADIHLWKMHGSLDSLHTVVMTINEAGKALPTGKRVALERLLSSQVMLFAGYSGYDNDIYPLLLSADHSNSEIVWCFRAYGRTEHVEALLERYGKHGSSLEYNLDRAFEVLGQKLELGLALRTVTEGSDSVDLSVFFAGWAKTLSTGEVLDIVSSLLVHVGDVEMGIQLSTQFEDWSRTQGTAVQKFRAGKRLGDLAYTKGKFDQALAIYESCLNNLSKPEKIAPHQQREHIAVRLRIATILCEATDYHTSEMIIQSCLHEAESMGDRGCIADTLFHFGEHWRNREESIAALKAHRRARASYACLGEVLALAACERSIAGIFYEQNRFPHAIRHLQRSLLISEETQDTLGIAAALYDRALIHSALLESKLAESLFERAAELAFRHGQFEKYELCVVALARMFLNLGEKSRAARAYGELHANLNYADVRRDDYHPHTPSVYGLKAREYCQRSLDLRDELVFGKPLGEVTAKNRTGDLNATRVLDERFAYVKKEADERLRPVTERYLRVIDGRERARDLRELADAHFFLANDYERGSAETLLHAKSCMALYEKLGWSDYDRDRFEKWIRWIETGVDPEIEKGE